MSLRGIKAFPFSPCSSWYFWQGWEFKGHLLTLNPRTLSLPVLNQTSVFRHWSYSLATIMFTLFCFMWAQSHMWESETGRVKKKIKEECAKIWGCCTVKRGLCVYARVSNTVGCWAILREDPSLVSIQSHQLTPLAAITKVYPVLCCSQHTIRENINISPLLTTLSLFFSLSLYCPLFCMSLLSFSLFKSLPCSVSHWLSRANVIVWALVTVDTGSSEGGVI